MAQHLFLTGEKGVGKSTLLRKILQKMPELVGGFFTVRRIGVFPETPDLATVHLLRAGTSDIPSKENLLFVCGQKDEQVKERFERLGCASLKVQKETKLLVMDELGPHEEAAKEFCQMVLDMLDGEIPIFGVLQKADSEFLKKIAEHEQVQVITVTRENRDHILSSQASWDKLWIC